MVDFIDKTSTQNGTPLNRANMMGLQGFENKTVTINNDGSITETNNDTGHIYTVSFSNNTIIETFVGEKTITKTTTINEAGSITEQINEVIQ